MNEIKQQQLTWNEGITNVPNDLVCGDNTCETELNMIYRNGGHRPIQKEQYQFSIPFPLLFVHKYNDNYKHYIALKSDNTLTWYDQADTTANNTIADAPVLGDNVQVEAIGNTLVVSSSKGLGYYLWKPENGNYKYLGAKIPEPIVKYRFINDRNYTVMGDKVSLEGICDKKETTYIGAGKQQDYNNAVVGAYSANKNKIAELNGFCNPFFVRYAPEMYDGSYTCISVPVLMIPVMGHNSYWMTGGRSDDSYYMYTYYSLLIYNLRTDYSEWTDLVKNIALFVSKGVDNYDTEKDQAIEPNGTTSKPFLKISNGFIDENGEMMQTNANSVSEYSLAMKSTGTGPDGNPKYDKWLYVALSEFNDVLKLLENDTIFYKIKEIPLTVRNQWTIVKSDNKALKNLTTQQRLPDDYFSNCIFGCSKMYSYNQRIHLIEPTRDTWEGAEQYVGCDYDLGPVYFSYYFDIYVYIKTNTGEQIVHKEITGNEMLFRTYFFYPDPKAYKAVLVIDKKKGLNGNLFDAGEGRFKKTEIWLKESPYLNGAWWFGSLPKAEYSTSNIEWEAIDAAPVEKTGVQQFGNQIWVSDVNNPLVFTAKGNTSIGNGKVLGLASQTTALSQGQFGQYPLIALCSDGVWALQTDNEGLYSTVRPMSREVCNNARSITETDGYIFFTSAKGLMVIDGGQVRCVSEKLTGRESKSIKGLLKMSFVDFLETCFIAYDYRDRLLYLMNTTPEYCYVYSMTEGTFSLKDRLSCVRTINGYPDTLLQNETGEVYSLLDRPNINDDTNTYGCSLSSRPMKWENSTALKTLNRVKVIFDQQSTTTKIRLAMYGSNDCVAWQRVTSLRGRGFKYWKFNINLSGLKASDSLSGVLIETQERYTGKIR